MKVQAFLAGIVEMWKRIQAPSWSSWNMSVKDSLVFPRLYASLWKYPLSSPDLFGSSLNPERNVTLSEWLRRLLPVLA
jgi:hypothetical protein